MKSIELVGQVGREEHRRALSRELGVFAAVLVASCFLYWPAIAELACLVSEDEGYSHIAVVPLISAWFLWSCRASLERESNRASRISASIAIGVAVIAYATGWVLRGSGVPAHLPIWIFSLVCLWVGCFIFAFGLRAARKVTFPLAFLLLMVPLPAVVLQYIIGFLQRASASVADILFRLLSVPVYRHSFVFVLPNLSIEVAKECSGIRSSISLMLTTLILGQLSLTSKINKLLLALLVVPVAILKNGIRIISLSLLSMYVDPSFITGNLHRRGGVVFFLLALALMLGLTQLLRNFEVRHTSHYGQPQSATSPR